MKKIITPDGEIVDVDSPGNDCDECTTVFFKTPYNHDTNKESDRTALKCEDRSLTDQSFKDEADINFIMERVRQGAEIPIPLPEHFGDAFNIPTLLEARERIAESNAAFYNLPARIRAEFLNDPARWEERIIKDINAGNLDGLEEIGLDMREVRTRVETLKKDATDRQASEDEKQLTELQNRLAKRAAATPPGTPAGGDPKGPGGTDTTRKA